MARNAAGGKTGKGDPSADAARDGTPPDEAAGTAPKEAAPDADAPALSKAERKALKKARKAQTPPEAPGTNKAVETMFRNAYRAELDTIALAAMKANIMISLNGLIISALMISGAFIFASSPAFLLPAGVFMLTAATSIVFALLSASPERVDLSRAVRSWVTDLRAGRAGWRDLRRYVGQAGQPHDTETQNVLIYEDRARMSREDHWDSVQVMLGDRALIYEKMSDHLHWLGQVTDRKFRLLHLSYSVFRWGLLLSLVTFVLVRLTAMTLSGAGPDVIQLRNMGIGAFSNIYEPSAVQQLPNGRLLVVEDEANRSINMVDIQPDGTLTEDEANDARMMRAFGRKLSDLEGLSIDENDMIYAITSHSLTSDGERRPDREQLLRFRIEAGAVGNISRFDKLREAIAADQALMDALNAAAEETFNLDDLNIEGLAYHRDMQTLFLGLRAPTLAGQSVILVIENPSGLFDSGEPPRFAEPILLDLSGGGIRALSFDPVLGAFLIVNEIEGYEGNRYSQLWRWSGDSDDAPQPVALPDIINLNNVESIDSILFHDEPRLLIMSDEGDEKKNEPARYMMLDYGQLAQ